MPINPAIAMGVQPLQLADPLAQYGKVASIQQAQQQGEMTRMQLEQMRRDEETLRQIQAKAVEHGGPSDLSQIADAYIKSGNPKFVEFGVGLRQKLDERDQFARIMRGEFGAPSAAAAPTNQLAPAAPANQLAPAAAAAPTAAPVNQLAATAPSAAAIPDVNALRAKRDAFLAMGTPQAIAAARALDADIAIAAKEPVYHTVSGVGLVNPRTKEVIVESKEATPAEIREYEYARTQGYKGSLFDFKRDVAAAGRAPVQPVAPTITQIIDPTDPNKMIAVDARRYQGGGAGSPGVIGVSGKEPSAALRENKAEAGKTQLQDDLENLRASFNRLNELRALPSTERGALSNIAAAAQGSPMGQMAGRAVGTEAQVERDVISSAKQRLLTSIKNATGMSAQQLNSNMELQSMLRSLSDVSLGYEASMRIIDDIENAYVRGAGLKKKGAPPAAPAGKSDGPSVSNW